MRAAIADARLPRRFSPHPAFESHLTGVSMLGHLRSGNKRTKTIWWILTVVTVGSFLGGFVFLAGLGRDQGTRARMSGNVGTVNGEGVSQVQWQAALEEARQGYRQRYGVDPQDRDVKTVEQQAWRAIVNE